MFLIQQQRQPTKKVKRNEKKILVPLVKIIIGIVKYLEENFCGKYIKEKLLRSPPEGTETKRIIFLIFIYIFSSFVGCVCVCVEKYKND